MRTSILIFLLILFVLTPGISQETKIGVNLAYNEIFYHTGNVNEGLPNFNIKVSSASAAFHVSRRFKKIGFTFETGVIEKAGLFEDTRNTSTGIKSEYHLNFFTLADFYPIRQLSISVGPEFTFPVTITRISDDQINFGSLIIGANYSIFKRFDTGFRFKYGVLPIRTVLFIDDIGNAIGEGKYSNDYIQVYVRFNLFSNMDVIDLEENSHKSDRKRKRKRRF